jgi:pimeloyl-ACP methyl ester carboxylesterase
MRRDIIPHQDDFVFMTEPTLHYVACDDPQGGHRMAYWQWGSARSAHVVMCVHGLTRQGRDFDVLAEAIVARAGSDVRVVCPDVAGRGQSDWLRDPALYQVPVYAADMVALLAQLHREQPIETLDYLGTSMGGLIGFVLAGHKQLPLPRPIRRFIVNDVGPTVEVPIRLSNGFRCPSTWWCRRPGARLTVRASWRPKKPVAAKKTVRACFTTTRPLPFRCAPSRQKPRPRAAR